MVVNFAHFGSVVIFVILGVFLSFFFYKTAINKCGCSVVFRMFLTILILTQSNSSIAFARWQFFSKILGAFKSRFLQRKTLVAF